MDPSSLITREHLVQTVTFAAARGAPSHHRRHHLVVGASLPAFTADGEELHALGIQPRHLTESGAAHQEAVRFDHAGHGVLDVESDMKVQRFALNEEHSRSIQAARGRPCCLLPELDRRRCCCGA